MTELLMATIKRNFCTRFVETLEDLIKQSGTNPEIIAEARTQYEQLSERVREYETHHVQVMIHKDNADKQDDLFIEYEDFQSAVRKIKTTFKNPPFWTSETPTNSSLSDVLNNAFSSQTSSKSQSFARLPKLDIPSFAGEIANWNSFYDLFNSSIHDNESLQPVQKFQYLRSLLKGESLALVKNLSLTDDNYAIARKLLENRYAHTRLISSYHLQTLLDLPKPIPLTYKTATKFVSSIHEHTEALKSNKEPVDSWDSLLAFILVTKLDHETRNIFERTLDKDHLPKLAHLLSFLDSFIQSQQWQSVHNTRSVPHEQKNALSSPRFPKTSAQNFNMKTSAFVSTTNAIKCAICSQPHSLFKCTEFHRMEPSARLNVVRTSNCCRNCLSPIHNTKQCQSKINCKTCNKLHHTMLHLNQTASPKSETLNSSSPVHNPNHNAVAINSTPQIANSEISLFSQSRSTPFVLLGTAIVLINDSTGTWQPVRALLDSGSESSYITCDCLNRLKLTSYPAHITVTGFGNTTSSSIIQGTTTLRLRSMNQESPVYNLSTIVVSHIIRNLPKAQLSTDILSQFEHLQLADPNFITPAPIDLLLGADLYFNIITGRKADSSIGAIALETTLGWIVSGPVGIPTIPQVNTLLTVQNSIAESLTKFWELEEIPTNHTLCSEDRLAEDIFTEKHNRLSSGRYVVPILIKQHPIDLGNSYTNALRCFQTLQRRLTSDTTLNQEYQKFMRDYLVQNHMSLLPPELDNPNEGFYLSHHGVLRDTNSTTKLRVVFNGSKKTTSNTSLNENLLTGPALQADLTSIIIRSRFHKVIFTADIRQMYRQILISEDNRIYQKILWSFDLRSSPQTYILNTVTYGLTSAPFLALRALHQLAKDEETNYPNAAKIILSDTYVDDIISGADSVSEALNLQHELIELLKTAGLELRKWTSNHPDILETVPDEYRDFSFSYDPNHKESVKILGLT